ncbi:MAG: DUF1573 domain-containing protein [Bacteroidetes bacterium]|nr:DUF1573 domain-containing protein [Bacteroidota bacterium]
MIKRILLSATLITGLFLTGLAQKPLDKKAGTDKKYPYRRGNLLVSKDNVKMNYVKNTEIRKDTILLKNPWNRPFYLGYKPVPEYMKVKIQPDTLLPGQEGAVYISFDAAKKADFGYCYENLMLSTNDTIEAEKYFFVMVYIEEDFGNLSAAERANGPRIVFKNETYDFGKVKSGTKVKYAFQFTNQGKKDLIIRRTKASCGCTASEPEKNLLKPGESSQINVVFDSTGLTGDEKKSIFVYSNDARYSTVTLQLTGKVE